VSRRELEHDEIGCFAEGPPDWLRIQITPPTLAGGSLQAAELELLAEQQRSAEGRLDDEALDGLAESGWLRQDVQTRGSYLSTSGLRAELDHPELILLNVPSGAVGWAVAVFEAMATYLDGGEARFESGEIFLDLGPAGAGAFTFAGLDERVAESIGFAPDSELLRVIPLP
jgi:hypothetical protein